MKRLGLLLLVLLAGPDAALGVGQPAPPLEAQQLDGGRYSLAAHRGEVVILNFWATWCVPCRAELPAFADFYQRHRAEGLSVLAVSMDDPEDLAKVRAVAATLPFPAAMYAQAGAEGYGRIWRLPITFIIDRQGRLRADGGSGKPMVYDLPALEQAVAPLLGPPAPITADSSIPPSP